MHSYMDSKDDRQLKVSKVRMLMRLPESRFWNLMSSPEDVKSHACSCLRNTIRENNKESAQFMVKAARIF